MSQAERERETEFGVLKESLQRVIKALYNAHNEQSTSLNLEQFLENQLHELQLANQTARSDIKPAVDSYS